MLIQIAALAWFLLGETPSAAQVLGILAVTVGITISQRMGWGSAPQETRAVPPAAGGG
jgi:drug/metabolite transporter (DMT)-like permease